MAVPAGRHRQGGGAAGGRQAGAVRGDGGEERRAAGRGERGRPAAGRRRPLTPSRARAQLPDWLSYQFPPEQLAAWVASGKMGFGGKYRGQAQRWFIFRFTGTDAEVDISGIGARAAPRASRRALRCSLAAPRCSRVGADGSLTPVASGHKAEFVEWRWAALDDDIVQQVVPFKRRVYGAVLEAAKMLAAARPSQSAHL